MPVDWSELVPLVQTSLPAMVIIALAYAYWSERRRADKATADRIEDLKATTQQLMENGRTLDRAMSLIQGSGR